MCHVTALPASVRVALWATDAWHEGLPFDAVSARALPDLDVVTGLAEVLVLWQSLGETAVLCALPRPGDTTALAGSPPGTVAEVTEAGECVRAPSLGAVALPAFLGTRVHWHSLDAAAVPRHRVEMVDLRFLRRELTEAVITASQTLDEIGGRPFASRGRPRLEESWGLPSRLSATAREVIALAGSVGDAARAGVPLSGDAPDGQTYAARTSALHRLAALADRVLADGTNAAVAQLAGWVPVRE